jgi:hypothetical protein
MKKSPSYNFGYIAGYLAGIFFTFSMYGLFLYGLIIDIKNHDAPFIPLTFIFTFLIFRQILQIVFLLNTNQIKDRQLNDINKIFNILDKKKFGGPN